MLIAIPIVHRRQHLFALMDGEYRTFGEHIQVLVGYDRRDLDDQV